MKINEKGEFVFESEDERKAHEAMIAEVVKQTVEKVGATKAQLPDGLNPIIKIGRQAYEPVAGESKHQANLRCKAASEAFERGELKMSELPKEVKAVKFFRAIAENDIMTVKALSEGSSADGGYSVPTEVANDLLVGIETYQAVKDCDRRTMASKVLDLNTITTKPVVYQVSEATAPTGAAPKFGQGVLTAKAFSGLLVISRELWDDTAIANFYQRMVDLFSEAFAARISYEIFVGSAFTGIFGSSTPQTTTLVSTSIAQIKYGKIVDMVNSLSPGQLGSNAKFYMHRSTFSYIQQMVDDNNRPIVQNPWDAQNRSLLGYPVVLDEAITNAATVSSGGVTYAAPTDAAATAYIAFGNLKWVTLGIRQEMQAEIYKEGTMASVNLAETRQKGIVLDTRWATVVSIPGNLAILKTAA